MTRDFLRARLWLPGLLLLGLLALAWLYRTAILHTLAPVESDYTSGAELAPTHPRPRVDLHPLWTVELEPGYGGAAIAGNEVLVLDREAGVRESLCVFDLADGRELWRLEYPAPGRLEFDGSRTTPVVVGDLVYTLGPFGQVHCIDRRLRPVVWKVELERDCGGQQPLFGW